MATYLPIRAFNRSQGVRIGGQKVTSFDPTTGVGVNTYIDIDDALSRKEYAYHAAIGAVYVTGPLSDNNTSYIVTGSTVTATPATYATGTVTVASGTATGSGTTFTAGMVGGLLSSGTSVFLVSGFTSATVVSVTTVAGSSTVAAGSSYSLVYSTTGSLTAALVIGDVSNRDTGLHVNIPAQSLSAIVAPVTSLKSRRDLVSVNAYTGALTVTTGVDYTTIGGTPNVPALPAYNAAIAYLTSTNGATTLAVTDLRPRS